VPHVLDLDPVPSAARLVPRGKRFADDALKVMLEAGRQHDLPVTRVPRRGPHRIRVQPEVFQPRPPLGIGQAQQRVLAAVQQVEYVQLHRDTADEPGARPPDMHPGLQHPEVRASPVQRHDLPVQDRRDLNPAGQDV